MRQSTIGDGMALEARGLGHRYGDRPALIDVSFRIAAGEIFGFLGPNGAGKSTLFRVLATLTRPQRGTVKIFGRDAMKDRREVRHRLGIVFQTASTDIHLTVAENLRFHGRMYGLDRRTLAERSRHYAAALGVEDRLDDRVGTLSGGLRRRVEIAKALLPRPRLLLLDEPSSGLDPGARRDLWSLLEGLGREEGVTVGLTTHFIEEAESCDRVLLLDQGRIVEEGTPAEMKRQIGGDVVTLTSHDPEALQQDLSAGFGLTAEVRGQRVRFEHPQAYEVIGRVAEAFPGRIATMTVAQPTLEDVFLRCTGHGLWEEEA